MSEVILIPVEQWGVPIEGARPCFSALRFLYELLEERQPEVNISHKAMPSFEEHEAFVLSKPYAGWWLILKVKGGPVGACYLTKQNEIGIQISAWHQRKGYARTALNTLIEMHRGRRLLANIAPGNEASRRLFEGFGFKHVQDTLALER